jgi:hypothetical protein
MPFDMPADCSDEYPLKYFVRVLSLDPANHRTTTAERYIGLFDTIEEMALWCRDYNSKNDHLGFILEAMRVIPEKEVKK